MRCFGFFLLFMVAMGFTSLSVTYAAQSQSITMESISYNLEPDERERIIFKLSGPIIGLNVFGLNGGKPRLVLDFPQTLYKGKNNIPLDNFKLAYGIRTGVHSAPVMKTRVVIDLASEYEVKYEQIISDEDTALTIILSPMYIEKIEEKADVPQIEVDQGIDLAKKEIEKTVPPAFGELKSPAGGVAESDVPDGGSQLLEISFDNSSNKGEMVIFRLNDFYPPTVSAIEEETPQVLCDFMDMELGSDVKDVILAEGKYVQRIRTARHGGPDKVRVILDLSPDRDYDLQQVFFKNDNLFVLIVNELPVEPVKP
jgi:hypothetical protein